MAGPPFKLSQADTCWLFVSDSTEPRHLQDIVHAVHILRKRSVPDAKIFVFTDDPQQALHLAPYVITNVHQFAQMQSVLANIGGCTAAMLVATGHGSAQGIGAGRAVLTPHELLRLVRTIPNLDVGALILCQCFAGIFNLVDARKSPPLVIVGGTNLNLSLSAPLSLTQPLKQADGTDGLRNWSANVFMMEFFCWLENPVDIDGDGRLTLADAYKAAGVSANQALVGIKSAIFVQAQQLGVKLATAAPPPGQQLSIIAQMQFDAADRQLQGLVNNLYLHQEPWLLHGLLAPEIHLA